MSLFGEYPCTDVPIPPSAISFTTASVSVILCLVTVVGNVLVVLAIFIDPNKDLKSPFNYFIANLAFADLIVGFVVDPLSVAYHLSEGLRGAYPADLVYIHIPYFMASTASVLSLAALALDRYVAITSPLKYRLKLNPKRAGFVAAGIWLFSLSFPFIYLETGYLTYAFVFMHTVIVLTFLVIVYTHAKIFRAFRNQVQEWDAIGASQGENFAQRQAARREQKVTKTFLIMLAFFLGCYLPSCVCIYITNLCSTCGCVFIHLARDTHFVLIIANSAMNPFVYAWRFENFRKACAKLLKRCSPRSWGNVSQEFELCGSNSTGSETSNPAGRRNYRPALS